MNQIEEYESEINQIVDYLESANDVFVVTGAGISADSGLPTYRGFGGLYDDKETEDGIPIEKALSGPMFRTRPEITWKYLAEIEKGARGATHNRAHEVLAEMESHFDRLWVLTQNIDGFHGTAGAKNVIEIHGNMHRLKCNSCNYLRFYEDYAGVEIPPICPECDGTLRPDVVLFEEQLPHVELEELRRQLNRNFDVVISIGTSSVFPYIVEPVVMAIREGVPTVEINPSDTSVSSIVKVKLPLGAAASLNEIWSRLKAKLANQN